MRKFLCFGVLLLSLCFVLLALTACEESKTPETTTGNTPATTDVEPIQTDNGGQNKPVAHTVTFDTQGGTEVPAQTVEDGKKAQKPADPEKPGALFAGWTYQGEDWSFIGFAVTENITLTAKWEALFQVDNNCIIGVTEYIKQVPSDLVIPASMNGSPITSIGEHAFSGCTNLTSITIPESIAFVGKCAFSGCTSLTSVYWNATNCTVAINYSYSIFDGCSKLSTVIIGNNVETIPTLLFCDCTGLTSVTIPSSVTSIGDGAFSGCSGLTAVTIPNSVTSIGDYAFLDCSGLTSITIPDSVTSIGNGAFSFCSGLTSITIPDSVTSIGSYAFDHCSGLTSITIPDSVTSIGEEAFSGCSGLSSVNYQGTKAEWNAISKGSNWNDLTGNYTIHCTDGTISK